MGSRQSPVPTPATSTPRFRAVAAIAAFGLFIQTTAPIGLTAAQAGAKPVPSAQAAAPGKPAAQAGAAPAKPRLPSPIVDGGWPRIYDLPSGGTILVYQPQVASWDNQRHLVAYSAVSQRAKGGEKPAIGTIKIEADTQVSLPERLVSFQKMKIVEANFQTLQKDQIREITTEIDKAIPDDERVIALDRVLANLDKSQVIPKNVEGVKADPPTIFFSTTPAVIMNLDGEPIWSPIKENDLKFAVNTNWDLFQHAPTSTLYLRNNDTWLKATDVKGTWSPAGTLPDSFKKLPAEDNWKDVKANLPGKAVAATAVPKVFVSLQPAELILLTGPPAYRPVQGTGLQWVSNTESDVFRMGTTGAVYYLVAGRWFTAADFTGPWTFATPTLAGRLQEDSARARALARSRVCPRDRSSHRSRAPRGDSANRSREQEGGQGAGRGIPGRSAVHADREDDGGARREHRQGRLQDRRSLLHVLPGGVVRRQKCVRSMGGRRIGAGADLSDSRQLALASRHLRHDRGRQ